ncbi:MAG: YfcE family phosphodiesterase [Leptotrichia sp.]|uniref:Phosphoesterase n=1 Tax=Leptotrichia rugosa TaxID=3239302 RepID=A0AB39VI43_9FUSO|nr:YfcE family phosphodiesterase [Leptotrichia sp. oral taxon 498]ASQ48066.1 YfcE family phosphodiesterase [Leptotrichia sp. oral taxon 498]RKW35160.1 MAG: YfcE family phosphodiesterase [Leptotrichia sp.]
MKALICSDSHQRLDYFQQVMELEEPEVVIFAGDHSTDAFDMSLVFREIPFAIVKGNTDYDDFDTRETKIFDLFGKKVLLTHGHLFNVKTTLKELEKKARYENVDICIFGHTHKEFLEEKNGIIFVNPGALQDKKYVMYYGGKRFEQKILK